MIRPQQVWYSFIACAIIGLGAMSWLTMKVCELDHAELTAREQARREEAIGTALWRIDTRLTPILAEEAARPSQAYQAFLKEEPAGKSGPRLRKASPLLLRPAEYALLNFQISSDNVACSPQCVDPGAVDWALRNGLTTEMLAARRANLRHLGAELNFEQLLAALPQETIAEETVWGNSLVNTQSLVTNPGFEFAQAQNGIVASNNDNRPLPQQNSPNININRLNGDLQLRNQTLQQYTRLERSGQQGQQQSSLSLTERPVIQEGVSKPLWVGTDLVLARRVTINDATVIQGCWFDWPKLRILLLEEVADLIPNLDLIPLDTSADVQVGRLLATLPVQAVVPPIMIAAPRWSAIRISLAIAWGALLVSAIAVGLLLQGVLTLSERRGDFVAAVTHELRTPLTTFRLYAEMLARKMVPEPERQQQYLETLRVESDRLAHLVDNVLQYARLERGRPGQRRETVRIGDLIERMESRLRDRAIQAEMTLCVDVADSLRANSVETDPAAIEQIVFNLVDNACKYATTGDRKIHLQIEVLPEAVIVRVRDNGPGISSSAAKKLFRPFSKSVHEAANSAPGVGLGLALCQRIARELGGTLRLITTAPQGATFELRLRGGTKA